LYVYATEMQERDTSGTAVPSEIRGHLVQVGLKGQLVINRG